MRAAARVERINVEALVDVGIHAQTIQTAVAGMNCQTPTGTRARASTTREAALDHREMYISAGTPFSTRMS